MFIDFSEKSSSIRTEQSEKVPSNIRAGYLLIQERSGMPKRATLFSIAGCDNVTMFKS